MFSFKRFLARFLPPPARTFHTKTQEQTNMITKQTDMIKNLERKLLNLDKRLSVSLMTLESKLDDIYYMKGKKRICPACKNEVNVFLPGKTTKNEICPHCRAYKRHRALWLYLENQTNLFEINEQSGTVKILHFAPEKVFYEKFSTMSNVDYYPVDFNPNFVGIRDVIDIQEIKYPDEMFDIIICSHLLEHIPDDRKAMKELRRVLKKGGTAYISCPVYQSLNVTFENPEYSTPELRLRNYGQIDHVRKYGKDFPQKLLDAGFDVEILEYRKDFTEVELDKYGLNKNGIIYKCTISNL